MLVTPELSEEVDRMLKLSQAELVDLSKEMDGHIETRISGRELTEIKLQVGDINLLIKRTLNHGR